MFKLSLILVVTFAALKGSEAVCGVCNINGVACVTKTEFRMCVNKVPDAARTFSCPSSTQICTKYGQICMDPELAQGVTPACGDTTQCGVCDGIRQFTCTSRNTFTMCVGEQLTQQRGTCPKGMLCNPKQSDNPCVKACEVKSEEICDLGTPIDVPATTPITPVTTTTIFAPVPTITNSQPPVVTEQTIPTVSTTSTSPTVPITPAVPSTQTTPTITTPSSTPQPNIPVCTSAGRFPNSNQSDCSGYINCFWRSGELVSRPLPCPTGRHFDRNSRTCEDVKPSWCA